MTSIDELAARLSEAFGSEDRTKLIAALLAAQAPQPVPPVTVPAEPVPPPEVVDSPVLASGPAITPTTPPEPKDSPEHRARLLSILALNPSGLPGGYLLDNYRIPPETLEYAVRDGQATSKAERGFGLTQEYGGAWARERIGVDIEAERQRELQAMFEARLRREL